MTHQKSLFYLRAGGLAGVVIAFIGLQLTYRVGLLGAVVAGIGAVVCMAAVVQTLVFYKCPHCGRHFSIRASRPGFCPGCGKQLDW